MEVQDLREVHPWRGACFRKQASAPSWQHQGGMGSPRWACSPEMPIICSVQSAASCPEHLGPGSAGAAGTQPWLLHGASLMLPHQCLLSISSVPQPLLSCSTATLSSGMRRKEGVASSLPLCHGLRVLVVVLALTLVLWLYCGHWALARGGRPGAFRFSLCLVCWWKVVLLRPGP